MRKTLLLDGTWSYETADGQKGEMDIPSNWHQAGLPNYAGIVTFRRSFQLDESWRGNRTTLRFLGVDYRAKVWLNGDLLGTHEGYFQPFGFDASGSLKVGENEVVVEVDSPNDPPEIWPNAKTLVKGVLSHHDCRPGSWNPERGQDGNTGGIWNSVQLVRHSPAYLERVRVAPVLLPDGSARLRLTCRLSSRDNGEGERRLQVKPANFKGKVLKSSRPVSLTAGTQAVDAVLRIDKPSLWWPWDQGDQPLYQAEVTLVVDGQPVDAVSERFGIRQIEIDEGWVFRINGRRFFPRGTNIIPAQWLSEYDEEKIATDVRLLREANVNFVRVHAHVNRDELYAACDEAGILVWQDFALQWSYEESDEFEQQAAGQMRDMIDWLYNHPSIVVWCCHNEPSVNRHTLDPLLEQVAREEDSTRYVDIASDYSYHPYPGWYFGRYEEFRGLPAAPFVNEFGAQALPNVETLREMFTPEQMWPPDWEEWAWRDFQHLETFAIAGVEMGESIEEFVENSQQYQAQLLKFAIEHYRAAKYRRATGLFQFMFVEFWPSITWAVVDYYRRPKKGYEALKRAFQPVLPVIQTWRRVWVRGGRGGVRYAISVVNDLPRAFDGARVRTWVLDPSGKKVSEEEAQVDVPADGVKQASTDRAEGMCFHVAADDPVGVYTVCASVHTANGELLGENSWTVRMMDGPPRKHAGSQTWTTGG
ncbi:MAG: beta-galactosidase [Anaerolineales bacterium]|nr:MAG: beta-galactosidase [Anaerolineales bacterium]